MEHREWPFISKTFRSHILCHVLLTNGKAGSPVLYVSHTALKCYGEQIGFFNLLIIQEANEG